MVGHLFLVPILHESNRDNDITDHYFICSK
ncbi:MAG: hypothetical protein RJA53_767 [Bacteroidota bacterium]|jgi:hypothetical protein